MSDSLQPHGPQHTKPPCPSQSPSVCRSSCQLNQWCYPTISSSATVLSFSLQSFPSLGSFPWVNSSHQVAKVLELQLQPLQWVFRVDVLSDWLVWSLCCPRDSQVSSPAPKFRNINLAVLSLLYCYKLLQILSADPCGIQ